MLNLYEAIYLKNVYSVKYFESQVSNFKVSWSISFFKLLASEQIAFPSNVSSTLLSVMQNIFFLFDCCHFMKKLKDLVACNNFPAASYFI